ncbi:hypothetical protein ACFE04_012681 [Oxalis oulophora]
MELSCAAQSNLPATNTFCDFWSNSKQVKATSLLIPLKSSRGYSIHCVNSALIKEELSMYGNGITEPSRILFDRFFVHNKNIDRHLSGDSHDLQQGFNSGTLKPDLHDTSVALKKKEYDLQAMKSAVLMQKVELARVKQELEQRKKKITVACAKQDELKEEVRQASLNFLSQSREIEELNFRIKAKDRVIAAKRSKLYLRESELDNMRAELMEKREKTSRFLDLILDQTQLANKANEVVNGQEVELAELHKMILEKEKELEDEMNTKKLEEEELKIAEENLGKFTKEWLIAQEEHNSLQILEEEFVQLREEKKNIESYIVTLKSAQLEIENEKVKIKLAEAKNRELEQEQDISMDLIDDLQKKLQHERDSLQQAIGEMSSLQDEIGKRNTEFNQARDLLQVTESKLIAAEIKIKHLQSEYGSFNTSIEQKNREITCTIKKLQELNEDIEELKIFVSSKEDHLIQENAMLKEKDEYVLTMKDELSCTKAKAYEAEQVVDRVFENNMVISTEDDTLKPFDGDYKFLCEWLQAQINGSRVQLWRAQAALAKVIQKLDERDTEIAVLKGKNTEGPERIYDLVPKRIGESMLGDIVTEKLQLESAQLDVEIVTTAIQKLSKSTVELLNKTSLDIMDLDLTITAENDDDLIRLKKQVARLSALSDLFVKEVETVDEEKLQSFDRQLCIGF